MIDPRRPAADEDARDEPWVQGPERNGDGGSAPPERQGEPIASDPAQIPVNRQIVVSVDEISPNARQPRHSFNPDRLQELANSIAQDGLVQPVVVRRLAGGYELIAGERRWRAAKLAGLRQIPAIVRDVDDQEALLLAIVENVVRADLNPVEVARGYASLVDELGLGASDVARRVGRSRAAVANTLRLLDLPDEVLESITRGDLTEGHGRAILQVAERGAQRGLAARAVRRGLTVRQTEALARRGSSTERRNRHPVPTGAFLDERRLDDLADALYAALEEAVTLRWTTTGLTVEFELKTADEAMNLLERLHRRRGGSEDGLPPGNGAAAAEEA